MTDAIVPDASVAVKWLLEEQDSPAAVALLRTGRELCAPELLRIEVAAAIVRRYREGAIREDDARQLLVRAASLLSEKRVRYVSDAVLLPHASDIALQIKHALQDCLYIACAEHVGSELVSADAKLILRASENFPFVRAL